MRLQKFIFLIVLSINCFSQSKFDLKVAKKERVTITNNGIDFTKSFVVVNKYNCVACSDEIIEANWKSAIFKKGIKLGRYYIDEDNVMVIDGDYKFEVTHTNINIYDANDNFNLVANISLGKPVSNGYLHFSGYSGNVAHRSSIINLLIASNK